MIFCEEKRIAFVFPAKTGSTAARHFFNQSKINVFFDDFSLRHATADEAKFKYPFLKDFTFYAFCRNPIDRFVSSLFESLAIPTIKRLVLLGSKDTVGGMHEFMNVYYERHKSFVEVFAKPQVHYFQDKAVIPLDFDLYESELRKVSSNLGMEDVVIEKKRKTNYEEEGANKTNLRKWLTPYVIKNYSMDCEFWVKTFNKPLIRE